MQDTDNMTVLPPTDDEQGLRRKKRDKLPKFVLGKNEGFYISRKELTALNDSYHQILSDMEDSDRLPEDMRSYMESVIFTSYISEINKLQRENCLDCEVERQRVENLNYVLMPARWRKWYWPFRLRRNQAAVLLDELINRQARSYYYKKESELPISEEASEAELDPYAVQLETLLAYLPRMRKKRRVVIEEIIAALATSYESKEAKLQRLNAELQAERAKVEELTAEAKKEAVKRLINCLNVVKEAKQPADWEILKLRQQLEDDKPAEEPVAEEEPPADNEETDEIEYWDEDELEEEDGAETELE